MITMRVLLLVLAVLCFAIHALGVSTSRVNLQSTGLALWALSMLVV